MLLCSVFGGVCCIIVKKRTPFLLPSCKNKNKLLYVAAMSYLNCSCDDKESNSLHEIKKRQSEKVEWEIALIRDSESIVYFCLQAKKINECDYDILHQLRICPHFSTATQLPWGSTYFSVASDFRQCDISVCVFINMWWFGSGFRFLPYWAEQ